MSEHLHAEPVSDSLCCNDIHIRSSVVASCCSADTVVVLSPVVLVVSSPAVVRLTAVVVLSMTELKAQGFRSH